MRMNSSMSRAPRPSGHGPSSAAQGASPRARGASSARRASRGWRPRRRRRRNAARRRRRADNSSRRAKRLRSRCAGIDVLASLQPVDDFARPDFGVVDLAETLRRSASPDPGWSTTSDMHAALRKPPRQADAVLHLLRRIEPVELNEDRRATLDAFRAGVERGEMLVPVGDFDALAVLMRETHAAVEDGSHALVELEASRRVVSAGLAAWPLAERAHQSPASVTRILRSEVSPLAPPRIDSFRLKLRRFGFVERQNILIKLCFARGGLQQLPMLAVELVRMKLDISLPSAITLRELYNGQRRQSRSSRLATTSLELGMPRLL